MSYRLTKYAQSLAEFGSPVWLPHSQGHVLLRSIPRTDLVDAVGCYPLFACRNAEALQEDLAVLKDTGAVSVTLVTDPLGDFQPHTLEQTFRSLARPYKAHYLVDLTGDPDRLGSSHHRRAARRAGRQATFSVCENPTDHLEEWVHLYGHLIRRHRVSGPAAFSRQAFAKQLSLPGVMLARAVDAEDRLLGMVFWFTEDEKAWYHLSGYSPDGYGQGVSHGLMDFSFRELRARGLKLVNLGAGAGLRADTTDGLSRFKQGWSTHTADAWLCGATLDPVMNVLLTGAHETEFFPPYRDPQLVNGPPAEEVCHVLAD